MDNSFFLKRIFEGYVQCFRVARWHMSCTYSDMTQNDINFFSDLGSKLGFLSIREKSETPPDGHFYNNKSNPRDLVWVDPNTGKAFLHVERENKTESAVDAVVNPLNKLSDSAKFNDGRLLVAVFGWITRTDLEKVLGYIKGKDSCYTRNDLLIIAFVGQNQNDATDIEAYVLSEHGNFRRNASSKIDRGGFWYSYFEEGSTWEVY